MRLLEVLFGCRHKNTAFPITRRVRGRLLPTYQVCLDCGREIPYDWARMQTVQTSGRKAVKQGKIEARLEG